MSYVNVDTIEELLSLGPMPAVKDPYPIYKKLRDESPVFETKSSDETSISGNPRSVLITRYDDVKQVLKDDETFSSAIVQRTMGVVMGPTIVGMDGKEHLKHRTLVTPSLTTRALKRDSDFPTLVRKIADDYIDKFANKGAVDLHAAFCFDFPLTVFTSLLGLPAGDVEKVHKWGQALCLVAFDPAAGLEASENLYNYMISIVQAKRKEPQDDMISMLVQAEVDGEKLSDLEVISFLRLLTLAGAETTNHLIGTSFVAMTRNPELFEQVKADRSLVPTMLEEAMRWESPVSTVMREAVCDTEIGGIPVEKDTAIICHIGSANRDERQFNDPDTFNMNRDEGDAIPFGYGRHYCAGSHLAKLEGEIGMNALLDRLDNVRAQPGEDYSVVGFSFRGPDRVPITFDTV